MKFQAYAILIAAIVVAAVLAFVLPGEQGQTAGLTAIMFAVITAFSALVSWPRGAAFVEQKSRWVVAAGIGTAALAVLVFVWSLAVAVGTTSSSDAGEPYIIASVTISMIAFLLISAPRISRQTTAARAVREARARPGRTADGSFDGAREGVQALATFAVGLPAFLQMAWPWLLASFVPPILAALVSGQGAAGANGALVGPMVGMLGLVVGLPTVCVAWHRWLTDKRMPRSVVALPNGAAFSYGWRLWVFVGIANRMAAGASDYVAEWAKSTHLPLAPMAESFTDTLVFGLICALMGLQAIRLPAVALGDKGLSLATTVAAAGKMRLALPLGILVTFAPFLLLRFVSETILLNKPQLIEGMDTALAIQLLLQFLEFVVGATFLSRAYVEVTARLSAAQVL